MEFKGTPAPWYVVERPDKNGCIHTATLEDANDNEIANLGLNADHYDLLLIAAAPELLKALIELTESAKETIDGLGDLSDAIDTAKAAITKALGQQ
ncbi:MULTISPECIES: hypothetical protein [unclassified Providencia]|uniref:hypothetical protein n=1 Tax=unclassified Providencia TaxID=2633465 RepID=UPI00234BCC89|nr:MULTISPECIES: hypothetical protein [unclassified Providencia]